MKVAYIGYYDEGSTARMRGEYLRELLPEASFSIVNIDVPLQQTRKIARTIGWRFKTGPLIHNINQYIIETLRGDFSYDLVWIDKGVFIKPDIIQKFRAHSKKLVHFTPDPAFTYHRSRLFFEALPLYDACITTKTFEIADYRKYVPNTIFCTQGYDPLLHRPYHTFQEKHGVVFIGHREDEREEILSKIVEAGISLTLAGIKWEKFAKRYQHVQHFNYVGKGVYGDNYAKMLSAAQIGLGLLSKWIPEKHTTRTFEIPACRTALLTEKNEDTSSFFNAEQAIFFTNANDIPELLRYYLDHTELLKKVTECGYQRVTSGSFDYKNILKSVLEKFEF